MPTRSQALPVSRRKVRVVDARAMLEAAGARLSREHGRLVVQEPANGLSDALWDLIAYHQGALATHVRLFPCAGCGREPFSGPCRNCSLRTASTRDAAHTTHARSSHESHESHRHRHRR